MTNWLGGVPIGVLALLLGTALDLAAQGTLGRKTDYLKYMEPLLATKDFGVEYSEDGAADATVLFPPDRKPREPVLALVRLGPRSLPLLIDCLSDQRLTSIRFLGSTLTKPMNVPLGYVCQDILMGVTKGKPVHIEDCADDGLGACMAVGFYFRPDDYSRCWPDRCLARPWVFVVQQNWRQASSEKRILFVDPYRH